MNKILFICFIFAATSAARAGGAPEDYNGPFTTQALYAMCSAEDPVSREKCHAYLQGLIYGLNMQRTMQKRGMPVCLPDMTAEAARLRVLKFIDGTTGGKPDNNKDGGDWMAFLGLSAGNICKGKK
jgi:hypothetical protein